MLKGKNLIELATAVQDLASRKVDVVADTREMKLRVTDGAPMLELSEMDESTAVTPHAANQIFEHVGVPNAYAKRMLAEAPALLEENVNHWLESKPSVRMVRTLNPDSGARKTRAFLSNRFNRMENDQLLATVLPELLSDNKDLQVLSTELTDTRMYLKVVFPKLEGEVRKGDVVQYGFTLSNSEIGAGAMMVTPLLYRLVCLNGMVLPAEIDDVRMRKAHLGRQVEIGADYFTDETLRADDKALQLKLRDTLRAFQEPLRWQAVLERLRIASASNEVVDPVVSAERVATLLTLPKAEANSVLTNFIKAGDLTKWGMANAVTAVANTSESYDRAVELENAGGRILTLQPSEWTRLAA